MTKPFWLAIASEERHHGMTPKEALREIQKVKIAVADNPENETPLREYLRNQYERAEFALEHGTIFTLEEGNPQGGRHLYVVFPNDALAVQYVLTFD